MSNRTNRQKAIIKRRIFVGVLALLLAAIIVLLCFAIKGGIGENTGSNGDVKPSSQQETSQDQQGGDTSSLESSNINSSSHPPANSEITNPTGENNTGEKSSVTVLNTGDVLIHDNVLWGAKQSDGSYNFSKLYSKANKYIKSADYAVANLEVTLGGTAAGSYRGYPGFNSPDSLLDYLKADGFDMLLTSNNHSLDTGLAGLKRTVSQIKQRNIDFLGTKEVESDPTYLVKNINGIKIGMACYTYGTNGSAAGAGSFINTFSSANLPAFYTEAQSVITKMKADGAEAIVFYMHWGNEYATKPNTYQKAAAQKLCNMGVDVIVGAHPHVIQPVELLYSEDSQNTTVCLYSMGNSISNQRISEMTGVCETGHTEDGVLFSYTFTKYNDGEVALSAVDIIPTWVDRYGNVGDYDYTMYPLENKSMANSYGLDTATANAAAASYERTKAIVGDGLTECQKALGCKIRFAG